MKPWQKGFSLEELDALLPNFEAYNRFSLSPFNSVKRPDIANYLSKNEFVSYSNLISYRMQTVRASSSITMYPHEYALGIKERGDISITRVSTSELLRKTDEQRVIQHFSALPENTWFECMTEDIQINSILSNLFERVGTKVSTFGELQTFYFKGKRRHPFIPELENVTIRELNLDKKVVSPLIQSIEKKLNDLPSFANHHSNYNRKKSWSAVSLRGFSKDPQFIGSPNESKIASKAKAPLKLQNTSLMKDFPEVKSLLEMLGGKVQRVRFMKLRSGEGELTRHTDLEDRDFGLADGRVMRIHFPIVTNKSVQFSMWNLYGEKETHKMAVGKGYFLDTRKPHSAINAGSDERTHLVIDAFASEKLRNLLNV